MYTVDVKTEMTVILLALRLLWCAHLITEKQKPCQQFISVEIESGTDGWLFSIYINEKENIMKIPQIRTVAVNTGVN